jgi:hypothetical protein
MIWSRVNNTARTVIVRKVWEAPEVDEAVVSLALVACNGRSQDVTSNDGNI